MIRVRRFWSVTLGMRAARVSGYDSRGGEFFAVIGQGGKGKANMASRHAASDVIERAIARGDEPGSVSINEEEAHACN